MKTTEFNKIVKWIIDRKHRIDLIPDEDISILLTDLFREELKE